MCHLVPGPLPCPEVVAVFYIRLAEVPTLLSVEGDAQVEQQNTVVGFLTQATSGKEEQESYEPEQDSWQISRLVSADTFGASHDTGDVWTGRMKIT